MSWDRKPKTEKRYYYRTKRVGGRVVKTYIGRGLPGLLAAQQDQKARQRRTSDRDHWDSVLLSADAARQSTDVLLAITRLLMRAVLVAHGYYLHRGHEWRRRGRMFNG